MTTEPKTIDELVDPLRAILGRTVPLVRETLNQATGLLPGDQVLKAMRGGQVVREAIGLGLRLGLRVIGAGDRCKIIATLGDEERALSDEEFSLGQFGPDDGKDS